MATAVVKPEIKLDPAEDEKRLGDIEAFEDDHDLKFPDSNAQAWLAKLPRDLWQAWFDVYNSQTDDTQIEIGKMRVYQPKDGDDPQNQRVEIRLNKDISQHAEIPLNYNMQINTHTYNNTVVFNEKDLPGHQGQAFNRNRLNRTQGIPGKNERYGRNKTGYRTAIPKQVALAPIISNEGTAMPVEDDAYFEYLAQRWQQSTQPKAKVTYTGGIDRGMHPGISNFSAFTTTSKVGKSTKKKGGKEKAVRISRDELVDALMRCFRRYRYWSLKALRTELKQPESYIKETLDDVAVLVRSGDFALNYQLKPQYQEIVEKQEGDGEIKEEVANVESGTDITADEMGDDEEADFEDVKMT